MLVVVDDLLPRVEQVDDPLLDARSPLRALVLVLDRLLPAGAGRSSRAAAAPARRGRRRAARRRAAASAPERGAGRARPARRRTRGRARVPRTASRCRPRPSGRTSRGMAEPLVVRAVARLVDVEQRHDQPGRVVGRPTRLVAWMYSAAVFGCPSTTIRPSRGMSRPDRDHVRRERAVDAVLSRRTSVPSRRRASATLSVGTREVSSTTSEKFLRSWNSPRCFADPAARAVARDRVADLLLDDPPRAAQLAQAVEVADQRHVRVGRVLGVVVAAGVAVAALGGAHQRQPALRITTFGLRPWAATPT